MTKKEHDEPLIYEEISNSPPVPPFSQALIKPKKSNHGSDIYYVLK